MTDAEFVDNVATAIRDDRLKLNPLLRGNLSCITTDAIAEACSLLSDVFEEEADPESDIVPALFFLEGYLHARREQQRGIGEGT